MPLLVLLMARWGVQPAQGKLSLMPNKRELLWPIFSRIRHFRKTRRLIIKCIDYYIFSVPTDSEADHSA